MYPNTRMHWKLCGKTAGCSLLVLAYECHKLPTRFPPTEGFARLSRLSIFEGGRADFQFFLEGRASVCLL